MNAPALRMVVDGSTGAGLDKHLSVRQDQSILGRVVGKGRTLFEQGIPKTVDTSVWVPAPLSLSPFRDARAVCQYNA